MDKEDGQDVKNPGNNEEHELMRNRGFAFESDMWREAEFACVELDEVLRQSDLEFVNILHIIRKGICTDEVIKFLEDWKRPLLSPQKIDKTNHDTKSSEIHHVQLTKISSMNKDDEGKISESYKS